jgi:hypothetical protein
VLHAGLAFGLAALPLERWAPARLEPRLAFLARAGEALEALGPHLGRHRLAADSYSVAALLAYHARRSVPVFGSGSSHARHDDILTDWRAYDGADLAIVRREPPPLEDYRPYFREVEARTLPIRGATLYAVLGRGLDYRAYRSGVLAAVRERYYRIPAWLPVGRCYFFERYFPA